MAEPIASLENIEFPKNSINIDKFTGFFDKLTNIFEGKCEELRGWARAKILLPQKHREYTTALQPGAQRQMRGTAGVQSRPCDRPGRPRNPQYAVP